MDGLVVAAALLSAFLHAAWNAAVKGSSDPRGAMAAQVVASGLVAAPLLAFLPLPPAAALPWLAGSGVFNLLAMLALANGYAHGGFGVVYPLARSVSPLLATLLARVLVGERLSATGYAGVALVSIGVALFASGHGRQRPAALGFALAAGVASAGYAVCDAQGSRLSPSTIGYGLTVSALNAVVFGLAHRPRGGGPIRATLAAHAGLATVGAGAATLSYLLILWVWGRTPIAVGAALRDTSIVFAAPIAVAVLKERLGRSRVVAIALVTVGAGVLRFA